MINIFLLGMVEVAVFLLILLVFYRLFYSIFIPLNERERAPFVPIPRKALKIILKAFEFKQGDTICDLGCGNGLPLVYMCKNNNTGAINGVGYEICLIPYLWAKIRVFFSKAPVSIFKRNFFEADFGKYDAIFCYLSPKVLEELESKFEKELKPGSRLVTYAFKLPNRQPDLVSSVYIYPFENSKMFLYKF